MTKDLSIIEEHLRKSKAFSSLFFDFENDSKVTRQSATKELALGMIAESMEVMNALNWKVHRQEQFPISRSEVVENLIDVYKYLLSAASMWRVNAEEFCNEFERKDLVNWTRYRSETVLKTIQQSKLVAAVDIDGFLCAYPENIIAFMNKRFSKQLTMADIQDLHGVEDAYLKAGVQPKDYRLAKQDFLEEGWYSKHSPSIEGASQFTHQLKDLGFTIVLLSGRPYREYNRIFGDTLEWCQANGILFDVVYWDKDKDLRVIKTFPNLSVLIDDDPFIANEVARAGFRAVLFERPYNLRSETVLEVGRFGNYSDIISFLSREFPSV